jgi:hypothetical protein
MSRAAKELIYLEQLASLDFGMKLRKPRLYGDNAAGITVAKKLGPGSKLRHLEVSQLYVQAAVEAGLIECSNFPPPNQSQTEQRSISIQRVNPPTPAR